MSDSAFVFCLNLLAFCAGVIMGVFWDEIKELFTGEGHNKFDERK